MNAEYFHALYQELIEENPFAVRAVLKVLQVEFTETVPTLAVTCETRPRLLVNLAFLNKHCRTDKHVKAVICHEFLHVLLRHTERIAAFSPAEHVAFDAVINAIIHRELGDDYSELMSRYYAKEKGVRRLLRPPTSAERTQADGSRSPVMRAWIPLYAGHLIADDIADLAKLFAHRFARDARQRAVVLAATRYQMEAMQERYKDLTFRETVEIGES